MLLINNKRIDCINTKFQLDTAQNLKTIKSF